MDKNYKFVYYDPFKWTEDEFYKLQLDEKAKHYNFIYGEKNWYWEIEDKWT